jgi:hypothetical protein
MKLGKFGWVLKALSRKDRPHDAPLVLTAWSIEEREVKPRPRMPTAPNAETGLSESVAYKKAWSWIVKPANPTVACAMCP